MQRGSRRLFAVNKATGHRWSPIPKPPPPQVDRLCGTHCVLNTLRVFYNATRRQHPHRRKLHRLFLRDFSIAMSGTDSLETSKRNNNTNNTNNNRDSDNEGITRKKEDDDGIMMRVCDNHNDMWIPPQYPNLHRILRLAKAMHVDVNFVERNELVQLCGERRNQNVVLEVGSYNPWDVASCPWPSRSCNANNTITTSTATCSGQNDSTHIGLTCHQGEESDDNVLFLDHVIDPGNVGAIMRSAFFLGVRCVVLSNDSAGCTAAVARASAGLMEHMHVYRSVVPTTAFLENTIAQHGAREDRHTLEIYAAVTMPGYACIQTNQGLSKGGIGGNTEKKLKRRRLLVLGNEDKGLPSRVVRLCSHSVHIPSLWREKKSNKKRVGYNVEGEYNDSSNDNDGALLRPQEISLNVSAASAIILAALLTGDHTIEIHKLRE